jgi:hypothetical protein
MSELRSNTYPIRKLKHSHQCAVDCYLVQLNTRGSVQRRAGSCERGSTSSSPSTWHHDDYVSQDVSKEKMLWIKRPKMFAKVPIKANSAESASTKNWLQSLQGNNSAAVVSPSP